MFVIQSVTQPQNCIVFKLFGKSLSLSKYMFHLKKIFSIMCTLGTRILSLVADKNIKRVWHTEKRPWHPGPGEKVLSYSSLKVLNAKFYQNFPEFHLNEPFASVFCLKTLHGRFYSSAQYLRKTPHLAAFDFWTFTLAFYTFWSLVHV